ncbi:MAG: ABC transporter substrate-binding protein [Chloroflexi bacterium]|nr:ABC transporter substrate-binding protein [Chloroflexota bacterium]
MVSKNRTRQGLTRREFMRLIALTGAGAWVAACAPAAPQAPAEGKAPAAEEGGEAERQPVTLRFWHHWGGNRVPLMEEQINRFMEKYPWITVEVTLQPWDQRLEKILTAVAANDPPDVTMLGRHDMPSFVEQNALLPLDSWMERDGVTKDLFYEAEFKGCQYKGKTWILPLPTGGALDLVWRNKRWFREAGLDPEKPPETWDELEEVAKALTVVEDGTLKRVGINVLSVGDGRPFFLWLYNNGGTWISEDLRTIQFNSPAGLEALKWMVNFTNDINGGAEEVAAFYSQTGEWENGPFYNDYEAMQINGSWEFFKIKEYAPDMIPDLGVSVVPHGPNGESHGLAYGGWGYVIPRGVEHEEEAWLLVKWLTTEKDGACWFLQQQKRPSPLKYCNEDPASGEGNPLWNDILSVMSQDVWVPITPVQPQIQQIIGQMTEEATYGVRTPEEALQWGAEEAQRVLDEYWAERS